MPVSVGRDADLLEVFVPHFRQNVDADLLPLKNLSQRFKVQTETWILCVKQINHLNISTHAYLAKKAATLMFKLVSGVTISVFEKSMLPSPG